MKTEEEIKSKIKDFLDIYMVTNDLPETQFMLNGKIELLEWVLDNPNARWEVKYGNN